MVGHHPGQRFTCDGLEPRHLAMTASRQHAKHRCIGRNAVARTKRSTIAVVDTALGHRVADERTRQPRRVEQGRLERKQGQQVVEMFVELPDPARAPGPDRGCHIMHSRAVARPQTTDHTEDEAG